MKDLPVCVERCLKSYDSPQLDWDDPATRYAVVREIYNRGSAEAFDWLFGRMSLEEIRGLIVRFRGDGMGEAQRSRFRGLLNLTEAEVPVHPFRDGSAWIRTLPDEIVALHRSGFHAS